MARWNVLELDHTLLYYNIYNKISRLKLKQVIKTTRSVNLDITTLLWTKWTKLWISCLYIVVTYHWHFDCYTTPVILYFKIYGPLKRIRIGSYVVVYVYIASFMNKKKSVAICIIDNIKPGLGIFIMNKMDKAMNYKYGL
jgi:hypothetical protein